MAFPWGNLAYGMTGKGSRTCIVIHNAGGNHKMMASCIEGLAKDHQVLFLDFRGHGQCSQPEGDYTVEDLAEDLYALCHKLGLKEAIFVGLNYGAILGVQLELAHPGLLSRLILLEPPIFMDGWVVESLKEHLGSQKHEDPLSYAKKLVDEVLEKGSEEDKLLAIDAYAHTPFRIQRSLFENLFVWDEKAKRPIEIPTLVVHSQKPFTSAEKLQAYFKNLTLEKVGAAGPWIPLEAPEELNQVMVDFLKERG